MATAVKRRRSGSEVVHRVATSTSSLAVVRSYSSTDHAEMIPTARAAAGTGQDDSEAASFWGVSCSKAAPFTDDEICQCRPVIFDFHKSFDFKFDICFMIII